MHDIGGGKSLWTGIFSSVRPAWKLFFNVDMANKPGYEAQPMLNFVAKFLIPKAEVPVSTAMKPIVRPPMQAFVLSVFQKIFSVSVENGNVFKIDYEAFDPRSKSKVRRVESIPLEKWRQAELEKELRGLKIRFLRPDGAKRDYRVNGFGTRGDLAVKMSDNKTMSVDQYLRTEYGRGLRYPKLLTLHVGNPQSTIYWPMEMTEMKKQVYSRSRLFPASNF